MSLNWTDGLATAFVGAAAVLDLRWLEGTTTEGPSGSRALVATIFVLGLGGCYAAKSRMEDVYAVRGRPRPPLVYVMLVSALGGLTLLAGILALASGSATALATLMWAIVAMWALATIRHSVSGAAPDVIHTRR